MITTHATPRSVENFPPNRSKSSTVRAASSEVAAECGEATPYPLRIRCVGFEAATYDHGVIGYATLEIGGVMVLPDVRVVHAAHGVAVIFPRRGVLQGDALARHPNGAVKMVKTVMFCRHEDWLRFSSVAVAAVRAAYPGVLPDEVRS